MKAELILENGVRFAGEMFGDMHETVGELIFNTAMVGYQEIVCDPSYAGQIVTMTFPLSGNYGINSNDPEPKKASMKALVVRDVCDFPSNFRCEKTLDEFMKEQGVVGISGIDTRALTRILRDSGVMKAVIATGEISDEEAKKRMASFDNSDAVMQASTKEKYVYNQDGKYPIALIDVGTKQSVIRELAARGAKVTVYPADTGADEIMKDEPQLVFVSNGPANPEDVPSTIATVRALLGKVPVTGMGMGHQIIGLALGGKVSKLKFGHHGANQPVKDEKSGRVYITSQNHNYILTDLPDEVETIFSNVNDKSCEGICHKTMPVVSIQFLDVGFLADRFLGKED